jgi:hypothetical protein
MDVIRRAVGVSAALLPIGRENVDPSVGKSPLRNGEVFLAERRERCENVLF